MTDFLRTLFRTDIRPFLRDLAPIGTMLIHAAAFCVFILLVSFFFCWGKEKIRARMEMRRSVSMKQLFCRLCVRFLKYPAIPEQAQKTLFVLAPLFAFVFSLFFFFFMPVGSKYLPHPDVSMLYFLFAASGGVYAFIIGGWSSASRFSFFGALRFVAQSLACQPILALVVVTILMTAGGSDLQAVMRAQRHVWFVVPHFPLFILYILSVTMMLAQAPFGSPKSDLELAGGIYSEYSGALYVLFLISENVLLLLCAVMGSFLFLGGTMPLFGMDYPETVLMVKTVFLLFVFLLIKETLPSWRTDKIMHISFKICLPFALVWLTVTAGALYFVQGAG